MITGNDRYLFTHGACWILAGELGKEAGYPVRNVRDQYGLAMHAVVELPDGRYLDIEGTHDGGSLVRHYQRPDWGRQARDIAPPDDLEWDLPPEFPAGEEEARRRAREICADVLALAASGGTMKDIRVPGGEILEADREQATGLWLDHMERCGCRAGTPCLAREGIARLIAVIMRGFEYRDREDRVIAEHDRILDEIRE